ncbi:hypothetical protein SDRG_08905 [Saprolegnia diclina VS20]|uniref:Uncharacterized protein n=1 Tax=Saprolegnia diclina (strain VS20) TaxID=1156394 RepID=T0RLY8_SAPDV|nr:hypothetical protein SDRG_08905 [Saprolegnia diclina VS20]EQC33388.1 hypothetical protein SDRG_08905 [Saprolegnia diclina VS20]|eukprot:XP_008613028.1 hypothetical protein SDRG_08905 [Saprolegnia diclina VS20]
MSPPDIGRFYAFVQRHLTAVTLLVIALAVSLLLLGSYVFGAVSFDCKDVANTALLPAPTNCYVGTTLGWLASGVWTACLLAQLLKDEFYSKCRGLSILWAWMNFTAASLNGLAVFYWRLPLFVRAVGVAMPLLECLVLHQLYRFRAFDRTKPGASLLPPLLDANRHGDVTFTQLMWRSAISLYVVVMTLGALSYLHVLPIALLLDGGIWLAIAFWSCEGFLQMHVNWTIDTCEGQSYFALGLTFFGKLCDFTVQATLTMPGRYLVLAYFSTAAGLLNVAQCVYMLSQRATSSRGPAYGLLLFIALYAVGFMTYVVVAAPFPIDATATDAWLHAAAPRWIALLGPLIVALAASAGYVLARRRGIRPITFASVE